LIKREFALEINRRASGLRGQTKSRHEVGCLFDWRWTKPYTTARIKNSL